jgi:hypothetical protein
LAPANLTDREVGAELLAAQMRPRLLVLADKGYISRPLAQELHCQHDIRLLTVLRRNQTPQPSAAYCHLHAHLRQVIEVVNSQLALQFHVETNLAHTFWGLAAPLHQIDRAYALRLAQSLAGHTRPAAPQVTGLSDPLGLILSLLRT